MCREIRKNTCELFRLSYFIFKSISKEIQLSIFFRIKINQDKYSKVQ
jgi:hypothetical protein